MIQNRLKSILKKDAIICKEIKWDASGNKKCISFLFVKTVSLSQAIDFGEKTIKASFGFRRPD